MGIPPDKLGKIFDAFYTTKNQSARHGLLADSGPLTAARPCPSDDAFARQHVGHDERVADRLPGVAEGAINETVGRPQNRVVDLKVAGRDRSGLVRPTGKACAFVPRCVPVSRRHLRISSHSEALPREGLRQTRVRPPDEAATLITGLVRVSLSP